MTTSNNSELNKVCADLSKIVSAHPQKGAAVIGLFFAQLGRILPAVVSKRRRGVISISVCSILLSACMGGAKIHDTQAPSTVEVAQAMPITESTPISPDVPAAVLTPLFFGGSNIDGIPSFRAAGDGDALRLDPDYEKKMIRALAGSGMDGFHDQAVVVVDADGDQELRILGGVGGRGYFYTDKNGDESFVPPGYGSESGIYPLIESVQDNGDGTSSWIVGVGAETTSPQGESGYEITVEMFRFTVDGSGKITRALYTDPYTHNSVDLDIALLEQVIDIGTPEPTSVPESKIDFLVQILSLGVTVAQAAPLTTPESIIPPTPIMEVDGRQVLELLPFGSEVKEFNGKFYAVLDNEVIAENIADIGWVELKNFETQKVFACFINEFWDQDQCEITGVTEPNSIDYNAPYKPLMVNDSQGNQVELPEGRFPLFDIDREKYSWKAAVGVIRGIYDWPYIGGEKTKLLAIVTKPNPFQEVTVMFMNPELSTVPMLAFNPQVDAEGKSEWDWYRGPSTQVVQMFIDHPDKWLGQQVIFRYQIRYDNQDDPYEQARTALHNFLETGSIDGLAYTIDKNGNMVIDVFSSDADLIVPEEFRELLK